MVAITGAFVSESVKATVSYRSSSKSIFTRIHVLSTVTCTIFGFAMFNGSVTAICTASPIQTTDLFFTIENYELLSVVPLNNDFPPRVALICKSSNPNPFNFAVIMKYTASTSSIVTSELRDGALIVYSLSLAYFPVVPVSTMN